MRHATDGALDELEEVLSAIRALGVLKEKRRGVFYLRSKAFLHFHEDPTGLYADVRELGGEFARARVSTKAERARLLALVRRSVAARAP